MKQICYISKSPEEFEQYLRSKTEILNPMKYRLWVTDAVFRSGNLYYGRIEHDRFEIIPLKPEKNFFEPIISGEFTKNADDTTQVVCHAHASPPARLVIGACLTATILLTAACVHALFTDKYFSNTNWLFVLEWVAFSSIFYLFSYLAKKKHFTRFVNFLQGIR